MCSLQVCGGMDKGLQTAYKVRYARDRAFKYLC